MSLTIDRIRELVRGRALPGSLACLQATCESALVAHGEIVDHCSCKLILAELGIAASTVTPANKKLAEKVLDAADSCGSGECAV